MANNLSSGPPQISRVEARTRGLSFYFTGVPCKRGHVAQRWVTGRHCTACKKSPEGREVNLQQMRRWYAGLTDEERRAYNNRKSRNWRANHPRIEVEGVCTRADVQRLMDQQNGQC